jgi:uncharacterized protein YxjI
MDEGLERAATATGTMVVSLRNHQRLIVRQRRELAELFGFETRNKYEIASESGGALAFAAEQQKGLAGFLFRQFLGHWRTFQIKFFSPDRQVFLTAHHPFRWFFQRLEVFDGGGRLLGAIQRRFSILSKRFDVEDASGRVIMQVASPFWRIWTFPFVVDGREVARVTKKWAGVLSEVFTDKDNFAVELLDPGLGDTERALVLAAAIYIDLQYFERKAGD